MSLFFIRHADAGSRSEWLGPDDLRPLTSVGWSQADGIAARLGRETVRHVLSSPSVRCRQSVEPLAAMLDRSVEVSDALAEGASPLDALRVAEKKGDDVVMCTHGDVLEALLDHLLAVGVDLGPGPRCQKASTWVVDLRDGQPATARYLPPPT